MRVLWMVSLLLAGCAGGEVDEEIEPPLPDPAFDLPNALGGAGHPLLPWPSDQYLDVSGPPRVTVAPELMPTGVPADLIAHTGFSRVVPIVAALPGSFDPASLPDPSDPGATLEADSPVRVVVLHNGDEPEPWPVLAEIDATAGDEEEPTLILRPHRPFPFGSQVVVGLRTSLQAADGTPHAPSAPLARVLADTPEGPAEAALTTRVRDALMRALPQIGPEPEDLALAWSFTIRTADDVIGPSLAMQDLAAEDDGAEFTLETVEYVRQDRNDPNSPVRRADIYGTLHTPWFLDADNRLVLDEDGRPVVQERRASPFLVTVPREVTETRPTVLYGHGFFSAIEETTWSKEFNGLRQWQMPAVTTRFHGFAEVDLVSIALPALGGDDIAGLAGVIDLQRQSQANFTVVHNLIANQLSQELEIDWPDDEAGPFTPLSPTDIPYMGISNGGTQGLVMMATSPVLRRGALVVPGGGWAHMLQRATQWNELGLVFSTRYEDAASLQLAMSMVQQVFDPVDSLNYAEHLVADRLPGRPDHADLLLIEAVHDSQVANLVTRWVVGAAGIPVLVPSVAEVWGAPTIEGEAPNGIGFESYDLGAEPPPPGNVAPPDENGVHGDVRNVQAYRDQVGLFLEEGIVRRTCEGPCDPE